MMGDQSHGETSNVTLQPNQRGILPDSDGYIAGEVPPAIAEQIMEMIAEFKKAGRIPQDADEYQLMNTMHNEMMKERKVWLAVNDGLHSSEAKITAHPALIAAEAEIKHQDQVVVPMDHLIDDSAGAHDPNKSEPENLLLTVSYTIKQNPSAINQQDTDGDTLLHRVCSGGMLGLAEMLLVNGANPSSVNNLKQTPLHLAAKGGQILIIQLLIDHGADVTVCDSNGWTALHLAASGSSYLAPHTVHYLTFCCGMSYATLTDDGQSLLHIVANIKKDNNRELLPILLSKPELDVSWIDSSGSNAMHYSVEQCQPHMTYLFACNGGASLSVVTNNAGKTPLDIAKNLPTMEGFGMFQEMEAWLQKGLAYKPSSSTPFVYYRHIFLPPLVLVLFVLLSRLFTPEYQGFLSLLGFVTYLILVFRQPARIKHISRLPHPSRMSGFVTGFILSLYVVVGKYVTTDGQQSSARSVLIVALYLCLIIGAVCYFKLCRDDPGFTTESKRKESGELYTMRDLATTIKRPGVWCPSCQLIPTKPSKHCKLCNRCVYWMDHHCLYTMRCVGTKNHFLFVWFVIIMVIGQGFFLGLLPGYVEYLDNQLSFDDYGAYLYALALLRIFRFDGLLFVVLLGMVGFLCMNIALLYLTIQNVSHGYTSFFNPTRDDHTIHISALNARTRLVNILSFLRTGKVKQVDPNFVI